MLKFSYPYYCILYINHFALPLIKQVINVNRYCNKLYRYVVFLEPPLFLSPVFRPLIN